MSELSSSPAEVDAATWIDLSRPSWPREVSTEHLDADADHPVVGAECEDPDMYSNCERCGLACTSDGLRHGFDA